MRPPVTIDEDVQPVVSAAGEMYASVLMGPRDFRVNRVPTPAPDKGMVRIRLEGCGVCASNVQPWEGREWVKYPLPEGQPGHEGWGYIDALGDGVTGFHVGQRVSMLSFHAFAQYDVASVDRVVALPPALDRKPFPAVPLGCVVDVFKKSRIAKGDTVAIVGIGFMGSLLTQMAANAGARVMAISRRPGPLVLAQAFGAQIAIPMDDHAKVAGAVRDATGGRLCDVVIEAAGRQGPLDLACELTRESGRLVIAGYHQDGPRQMNLGMLNWRGIEVVNAHERDPVVCVVGMKAAVEEAVNGRLAPWPLFTHTFPMEELGPALALTRDRPDGFMKALIEIAA
jgi:NADPH:quinone reductase